MDMFQECQNLFLNLEHVCCIQSGYSLALWCSLQVIGTKKSSGLVPSSFGVELLKRPNWAYKWLHIGQLHNAPLYHGRLNVFSEYELISYTFEVKCLKESSQGWGIIL